MFIPVPKKTIPVLFSTLYFMCAGSLIPVIFVEKDSVFISVLIAILFHVPGGLFLRYIIRRSKQGNPLLGLSNGLWFSTSLMGYIVSVVVVLLNI